ncbi:MAG TPA: TMEM175 family protein, partial [Gaiellaceae bacterium]
MSPARLETFADGVFAIAATLLILTVDGAVGGDGVDLGFELAHAWPSYVAYAVSFVTIGIMWMNHHAIMDLVDRVDRRFLMANLGLLMCIAFVPFP